MIENNTKYRHLGFKVFFNKWIFEGKVIVNAKQLSLHELTDDS
jgi:hypothetical protein